MSDKVSDELRSIRRGAMAAEKADWTYKLAHDIRSLSRCAVLADEIVSAVSDAGNEGLKSAARLVKGERKVQGLARVHLAARIRSKKEKGDSNG